MTLSLDRVFARPLRDVTFALEPGLYCVLGAPEDGTERLVELCAGTLAPRRGRVLVAGADPRRDPSVRRRIGAVLANEELAGGRTVRAAVAAALAIHGSETRADAMLAPLEPIASRELVDLSPLERRRVALAVALAVPEPLLLALHEPFGAAGPASGASAGVLEAVAGAARAGAVVLCTTASVRDALAIGGTLLRLRAGGFGAAEPLADAGLLGAAPEICVRSADAPALAAALVGTEGVLAVAVDHDRAPGEVRLRTSDADRAVLAIAAAARGRGISVEAIEPRWPSLEALHAAQQGHARAAYEAAYLARWHAQAAAAPVGPDVIAAPGTAGGVGPSEATAPAAAAGASTAPAARGSEESGA